MLGKCTRYFICILFLIVAQDKKALDCKIKSGVISGVMTLWKIPDSEIKLRAPEKFVLTFLQDVCTVTAIFKNEFYRVPSMSLAL